MAQGGGSGPIHLPRLLSNIFLGGSVELDACLLKYLAGDHQCSGHYNADTLTFTVTSGHSVLLRIPHCPRESADRFARDFGLSDLEAYSGPTHQAKHLDNILPGGMEICAKTLRNLLGDKECAAQHGGRWPDFPTLRFSLSHRRSELLVVNGFASECADKFARDFGLEELKASLWSGRHWLSPEEVSRLHKEHDYDPTRESCAIAR